MASHRVDADIVAAPVAEELEVRGDEYYHRLRTRLRVGVLAAYLSPLVLLAVWFTVQSSRTVREEIDAHLLSAAEHQRNTVDLFLQERLSNVRNVLLDPGRVLPPAPGELELILERLQRESEAFEDVGLFDEDGTLVDYAGPYPSLLGRSYAGEDWFRSVVEARGGEFISDVYLGFRGHPHFIVAVTRPVGGRLWTVRASVDPADFAAFVARAQSGKGMETLIVNADGERQTLDSADQLAQVLPVSWTGAEPFVRDLEEDGVRYVAAVSPLEVTRWALLVRVPAVQALVPLRQEQALGGGLLVLAAVLVSLLALRTTTKLVDELRRSDAAKADLRGHLFEAAKLASVGEMAAGIAHEINNPLAVIYEEAGMMQDMLDPEFGQELDPDEFRERLGEISETVIRGREITRQLLTFARHHEPTSAPVAVNDVVERALASRAERLRLANVDVETELAGGLPVVMGDANQLEQVLVNLINNARDAMQGGGTLTLRTATREGIVRIEVRDTGQGMAPDVLQRVFFPFFTTKEVGKGTGLGLSISYGIIKAHEGRIEVESEVGKGTTFRISLPSGEAPAQDAAAGAGGRTR